MEPENKGNSNFGSYIGMIFHNHCTCMEAVFVVHSEVSFFLGSLDEVHGARASSLGLPCRVRKNGVASMQITPNKQNEDLCLLQYIDTLIMFCVVQTE